jgi:5-methylcytosine-specific restriction endonuclease McrA
MTYLSETLRQQVIQRANGRCEYCLIHQDDSLYAHEVDHIIGSPAGLVQQGAIE